MHTIEDLDGLRVLVVGDMNRRFDPITGVELPARKLNTKLVHAREIARHYGIPFQTIGMGDDRVPGVWELVYDNHIGLRVPYNDEDQKQDDYTVREWQKLDASGNPVPMHSPLAKTTEQIIVTKQHMVDTDDGMYVRLDDLLLYADAQGWVKGKGRPKKAHELPMGGVDVAAIVQAAVAGVLAQLGHGPVAAVEPAEPKARSPKARANDAWIAAGRPQPGDQWKADWVAANV